MSAKSPFQFTCLLVIGALPLMVACGPGDITAQASQKSAKIERRGSSALGAFCR